MYSPFYRQSDIRPILQLAYVGEIITKRLNLYRNFVSYELVRIDKPSKMNEVINAFDYCTMI